MALRFRKSFKLAPGVRMNVSGGGIGWSLGPRGATIGVGKRGTYLNTGIPGTGLSARQRLGGASGQKKPPTSQALQSVPISVGVSDDGEITFKDGAGNALPEQMIRAAKKQHGEAIKSLIQKKCDEINREIDSVGELHLLTPSPLEKPTFARRDFDESSPIAPTPKKLMFPLNLFRSMREKVELKNSAALVEYESAMKDWNERRAAFDVEEEKRRELIEVKIYKDTEAMNEFLEAVLQEINWPRETLVSSEILDEGRTVYIDVDLPEIEDMPNKKAAVPASGYKLSVKDLSAAAIQRLYMSHIHGIVFRAIGETFSALPVVQEVVLSGYSQRPEKATGHIVDEYLLSVRVSRSAWSSINFENLEEIDVIEALSAFDLKRSMSKTGVFRAIEPYAPPSIQAGGESVVG